MTSSESLFDHNPRESNQIHATMFPVSIPLYAHSIVSSNFALSLSTPMTGPSIKTEEAEMARWKKATDRSQEVCSISLSKLHELIKISLPNKCYAYTFYTALLERETFSDYRPGWLEALGDLARYRIVIDGPRTDASFADFDRCSCAKRARRLTRRIQHVFISDDEHRK